MLRVGFIDYLNCLPLEMGLEATGGLERVELVRGTPSQTNAALLSGEVDLGLISSLKWAQSRDRLKRIPGYGIASEGEVMSVLVAALKDRPIGDGAKVALTSESATSQVLARIYLEQELGLSPHYETISTWTERVLTDHDAALVIGDSALEVRGKPGVRVADLGEAWYLRTGLPMVYAVWATIAESVEQDAWLHRLARAVDWVEGNLEAVVDGAITGGTQMTEQDLRSYFGRCIGYRIGNHEEKGLDRYLAEWTLLSHGVDGGRAIA